MQNITKRCLERDEFLGKCQKGSNQQLKSYVFKNIQNNAILEFFRNLAKKNPKTPFTELVKKRRNPTTNI